ncbi:YihY/virulence factor BrkB family protein [Pedobacter alpinus]|uniref:YihY/virulence factor BrkB family protein n=1 Tax=Pedobacter alpinus TaxID=1590643 RepID=A0ABW5TQM5_9SPHI
MEKKNLELSKTLNFNTAWSILVAAFKNFSDNDPLRIAAATAFFGTFAIPAILVVILQIFGIFFNRRQFGISIITKLQSIIGEAGAQEIRHFLRNMLSLGNNWFFTILMFIFLIFVSTTLFVIIRNSINQLWFIRLKENLGFYFNFKQRLKSLLIISAGGFLLLMTFIFEGIRLYLTKMIEEPFPFLEGLINEALFFVSVTIWFCLAFRFIANGKPAWKPIIYSAIFTGILLTLGKIMIRVLLLSSNINQIYGASAAILLVMLFIFYCAFIFYYGISLVSAFSDQFEKPIAVSENAFKFKTETVDA